MMSRGTRGENVRALQEQLNYVGYELDADGIFGKDTHAAVRHFQDVHSLTADGIVGPKTQSELDARVAEEWVAENYSFEEWDEA